jgi:hypothetical protein
VITLEPAPGYALGEPSSAEMFIKNGQAVLPCCSSN